MVGQEGQIFSTDPNLERALEMVRADHHEAEKFAADPEHYLQSKGVKTEGLKFSGELADDELESVSGGMAAAEKQLTICGSVGCILCGSVGG
jgi:hypothetical protein